MATGSDHEFEALPCKLELRMTMKQIENKFRVSSTAKRREMDRGIHPGE